MDKLNSLIRKGRCREKEEIEKLLQDNSESFLRKELDINEADAKGKSTFLHSAVWFNCTRTVESLLKNGADSNAKNVKVLMPCLRRHATTSLVKTGTDSISFFATPSGEHAITLGLREAPRLQRSC